MRTSRRASALIAVLLLSVLILLLLLAFATSSTNNLSLTRQQVDGVQGDALARSAVEEFLLQLQERHQPADASQVPRSIFEYFPNNPVLIRKDSRLDSEVRLLTQGANHSVDNSLSSLAAQSCFDRSSQKSIPPFSVSLVFQVESGRRTFLYEAFLQQVWPYALTAPGPIRVLGREPNQSLGLGLWKGPSAILGKVLATRSDLAAPVPMNEPGRVSENYYSRLFGFSRGHHSVGVTTDLPTTRVQVGGDFSILKYQKKTTFVSDDSGTITPTTQWLATLVPVGTLEALVDGSIDLYENPPLKPEERQSDPEVYVDSASKHNGSLRKGFRFHGLDPDSAVARQSFQQMFRPPDTSGWTKIANDQLALLSGETVLSSQNSGSQTITIPSGQVVYEGNIGLGGTGDTLPSLVLEDMALAVKGDVVLGPGGDGEVPTLRGSNATLIVEGSLIVDNGQLDAGGNGMVIFCRDFVIRAKGCYNGLIIAQNGGAFVGADPSADSQEATSQGNSELTIRGGVIVGGRNLTVAGPPPVVDDNGLPSQDRFPAIRIESLAVLSTRIEYDPKYLRTVNQFGNFRLLALQRRQ